MRKNLLILQAVIITLFLLSGNAYSAWTQPKGQAYNQLTLSHYKTTQKFISMSVDSSGSVIDPDTGIRLNDTEEFKSTKITYYSEYGISDKLTVFTTVPWDWQRSSDTIKYSGENGPSGIGDIILGLRQKLVDNVLNTGVLMSVQGEVKIPEAYEHENPLTYLSLGDGQYDTQLALLFARGLGKGYAWLSTGYKYRFENEEHEPLTFKPSDVIKVSIGGGYSVNSWLSIRGLIGLTKSVGNAKVSREMVIENKNNYGGLSEHRKKVLVKDTLGLEPDALSVGVDLVFNISSIMPVLKTQFPHKEIVVSYNTELAGFGDFRTKDYALGETFSLALVFPGEGIFPVNLFTGNK